MAAEVADPLIVRWFTPWMLSIHRNRREGAVMEEQHRQSLLVQLQRNTRVAPPPQAVLRISHLHSHSRKLLPEEQRLQQGTLERRMSTSTSSSPWAA